MALARSTHEPMSHPHLERVIGQAESFVRGLQDEVQSAVNRARARDLSSGLHGLMF